MPKKILKRKPKKILRKKRTIKTPNLTPIQKRIGQRLVKNNSKKSNS